MNYVNKIPSLEEMSSAQVAINFCQDNGFKEIAMLLEKSTYGTFLRYDIFASDPQKLYEFPGVNHDSLPLFNFERSCSLFDAEKVRLWDTAIEEQCQKLVKGIPNSLRQGVQFWIKRIALEYLSYSRRQETFFSVSRYLLMDVLSCEDCIKAGRLDEKKLAERLLQDGRLTVLQRYRVACAYCLHVHIPQLWLRLTQEEKQLTCGKDEVGLPKETHDLVLLWSCHMEEEKSESETYLQWTDAARKATLYGNHAALMVCWEKLKEHVSQQFLFDMALLSLQSMRKLLAYGRDNRKRLISDSWHADLYGTKTVYSFNLPSHHSELMCFFLSQMDEEQQLIFFKKAFQSAYIDGIVECFLEWPHQDDFLPTINWLWGIIPMDKYAQCLLALVNKYNERSEKENSYYDYRNLLVTLWEQTPEEYKQYVFNDSKYYNACYVGFSFLNCLLEKCPFREEDEALFKKILCDQPLEERKYLINPYSKFGENICLLLKQKEKWPFVNWLLEACLPSIKVPIVRKEIIQSNFGLRLCLDELKQNRESFVEDLISWSFNSDTDKEQFKNALRKQHPDAFKNLIIVSEFHQVKCCKSWDFLKKLFAFHFNWGVPKQHKFSGARKINVTPMKLHAKKSSSIY